MNTVRCDNTRGQKYHVKRSRKESKIKEFMYIDITNAECEMYYYAGNNCRHRNTNKNFRGKFESHKKKTFSRFVKKKKNCTSNLRHNTKSTGVRNLKFERWGTSLVQEMYMGGKTCDKKYIYIYIYI